MMSPDWVKHASRHSKGSLVTFGGEPSYIWVPYGPVSYSRNPGFGQAFNNRGNRFRWPCKRSSLLLMWYMGVAPTRVLGAPNPLFDNRQNQLFLTDILYLYLKYNVKTCERISLNLRQTVWFGFWSNFMSLIEEDKTWE